MTTPGGREDDQQRYALRIPGRVYDHFARKAYDRVDAGEDLNVCDAPSRLRLKRRGAGHTVYIRLEPEQVERLAAWVDHTDPKLLRDYRDAMLAAVASALR